MTTEQSHHVVPMKIYVSVFLALLVGTAVTVWVARIHLSAPAVMLLGSTVHLPLTIMVALSIAVIKATLVVLFFMHLRYSHRLNWIFMTAAVLWLALMLGVVMTDVMARDVERPGRQPAVPQALP